MKRILLQASTVVTDKVKSYQKYNPQRKPHLRQSLCMSTTGIQALLEPIPLLETLLTHVPASHNENQSLRKMSLSSLSRDWLQSVSLIYKTRRDLVMYPTTRKAYKRFQAIPNLERRRMGQLNKPLLVPGKNQVYSFRNLHCVMLTELSHRLEHRTHNSFQSQNIVVYITTTPPKRRVFFYYVGRFFLYRRQIVI